MYTTTQRLLQRATQVREAMAHEPDIRPSFEQAGLPTIVLAIFALIWNGTSTASEIYRYLSERGCRFDRDAIDFLLISYEGDDPQHHLWTRHNLGDYLPLFDAMPTGEGRRH